MKEKQRSSGAAVPMPLWTCNRCNTPLQGRAVLCIRCFGDLCQLCPHCMIAPAGSRPHVRRVKDGKGPWRPVDCRHCNNERYLLSDYVPFGTEGSVNCAD